MGQRPVRARAAARVLFLATLLLAVGGVRTAQAIDPTCLDLPATPDNYASPDLPPHFLNPTFANWDSTPLDNPLTDDGATLGRVLFYDKHLSRNDTVSCSSCHRQENAFSDPNRFSTGFEGGLTGRNSMSIVESRFYKPNRFFWDHRVVGLEGQALMPIQNEVEMGMTLPDLVVKLSALPYYGPLFTRAFGDPQITSDRIAKAIAQFDRSLLSYRSKYDVGMAQVASNDVDFPNFTAEENLGKRLFLDGANQCRKCHMKSGTTGDPNYAIFTQDTPTNNGLDAALDNDDDGIGGVTGNTAENGVFKAPTLRNVLLTAPYMHDGRFATIEDVLDFYASGIQPHPNLNRILTLGDGSPRRIVFTAEQRRALIAFFGTLTDQELVSDPKFADPFCDGSPVVATARVVSGPSSIGTACPATRSFAVVVTDGQGDATGVTGQVSQDGVPIGTIDLSPGSPPPGVALPPGQVFVGTAQFAPTTTGTLAISWVARDGGGNHSVAFEQSIPVVAMAPSWVGPLSSVPSPAVAGEMVAFEAPVSDDCGVLGVVLEMDRGRGIRRATSLRDNGRLADAIAGDGRYSGRFRLVVPTAGPRDARVVVRNRKRQVTVGSTASIPVDPPAATAN
ncbi:MAG: cytochrome-c peroxidase [Alphaproteobacteria bacterium]